MLILSFFGDRSIPRLHPRCIQPTNDKEA